MLLKRRRDEERANPVGRKKHTGGQEYDGTSGGEKAGESENRGKERSGKGEDRGKKRREQNQGHGEESREQGGGKGEGIPRRSGCGIRYGLP